MSTLRQEESFKKTPFYEAHKELGARLVPFAGYQMPLHYPDGILSEHLWTRQHAGFFDVSHMGQAFLKARDHETVARALEALVPGEILNLAPGRMRYTQLLTGGGGMIDDLMVTRPAEREQEGELLLVVNASRAEMDYGWIKEGLPSSVTLTTLPDYALIALQGPSAERILSNFFLGLSEMPFMSSRVDFFEGIRVRLSRSGYTGEDGFEISVLAEDAPKLMVHLLSFPEVKPIGLGARDSLRLEAGLCLYGHDIDETTSPVEADLLWSISKRRREEGGFIGAERVLNEIKGGVLRKRVGLLVEGRLPAREGAQIQDPGSGKTIGRVTSGGFGPSVNGPIAMGYVESGYSAPGTELDLVVRGNTLFAKVVKMPFVPNRYKR